MELPKKLEMSQASGTTTFHPRDQPRREECKPGMYNDTHTMNSGSEDNQKDISTESGGSVYEPASQK